MGGTVSAPGHLTMPGLRKSLRAKQPCARLVRWAHAHCSFSSQAPARLVADYAHAMDEEDLEGLLRHLDEQARYLASLTAWARENPAETAVLLRVRDEVFTLRETLDTLGVPHATLDNEGWRRVPHAEHRPPWPSADADWS
jgi:hypothetical protein